MATEWDMQVDGNILRYIDEGKINFTFRNTT